MPLVKVQPEFKKTADKGKAHPGQELFSHGAILQDICMDSNDTQLSSARDSPLDKLLGYPSSAMFRMHHPSKNDSPDI
jgi:hypothetical protein